MLFVASEHFNLCSLDAYVVPRDEALQTERLSSAGVPQLGYVTPNPSIEGTSNIWLRQLSAAPHVKR